MVDARRGLTARDVPAPHGHARGSSQLIGLDWGTTSLRAYLFDARGVVVATKAEPWGVMAIPGGDFGAAYHTVVADWRAEDPSVPVIAAGMIGSTEGWIRAPYRACPAGAQELAASLVVVTTSDDGDLHVVPGVELRGSVPGVMRGEETQVVGALTLRPDLAARSTLVLPGTHAKWVDVDTARIVRFTTYITGELFAVLREHSILGRPARKAIDIVADASSGWEGFDQGLRVVRESGPHGIAPLLFLTRSLVLQGAVRAQDSLDFLSGLLIGDEVRSALATASPALALIGEPALCERYRRALAAFGVADVPILDGATPAGLWTLGCQAQLVMPVRDV